MESELSRREHLS
jgi:hypothetical protein